MKSACLVAVILVSVTGCGSSAPGPAPLTDSAKRVRDGLDALAAGGGDWSKFSVVYDDRHGTHGGLALTIRGNGKVTQEASREEVGAPQSLTPADLKALVDVLHQQQVWEQRVPEREATPDEGQARLTTTYGPDSVTVWEWYNERDRLGEVRKVMTNLAWKTPR